MKFGFIAHPDTIALKREVKLIDLMNRMMLDHERGYDPAVWRRQNLVPFYDFETIVARTGHTCQGILHFLPLTADEMLALGLKMPQRIIDGVESLWREGAELVGLGGFTGIIGSRGFEIQSGVSIPVTTGNSLTAYASYQSILEVIRKLELNPGDENIAILGFPGSISQAIAILLLQQGWDLTLVYRGLPELGQEYLKYLDPQFHRQVTLTNQVEDCYPQNRLYVTATSSGGLIDPRCLLPGSVVIDVALPRDVIVLDKPVSEVLLLDGGLVSATHEVKFGVENFEAGLLKKMINGCLAETLVLALENRAESFSLGRKLPVEKVLEIGALAEKHGFFPEIWSYKGRKIDADVFCDLRKHYKPLPKAALFSQASQIDLEQHTSYRFRKYINPVLSQFYRTNHIEHIFLRAEGCSMFDASGTEYLDMTAGYGCLNLGHNHPRIIQGLQQFLSAAHPNFNQYVSLPVHTAKLAEQLCQIAPGCMERVFFSNSGTEAVEAALKLARLVCGPKKILYALNSYHGKTLGALSVTGREKHRKYFYPLLEGFEAIDFGDAESLAARLAQGDVGAVILEPIQGEGGVIIPPDGYLKKVEQLCRRTDTLLILDEIQTGFGRTGKLFACQWEEVAPDILVLSKSLSGGIMPIGATLSTAEVWNKAYGTGGRFLVHSSTFGGGNLAATAGLLTLETLAAERIPERALEVGTFLKNRLLEETRKFPFIKSIRGKGLMLAIEFQQSFQEGVEGFAHEVASRTSGDLHTLYELFSDETRECLEKAARHLAKSFEEAFTIRFVTKMACEHRILTFLVANANTILRIQPPLILSKAQAEYFVTSFVAVCEDMSTFLN